jgi:DNA-binding XRE family transcriptional regulator
MDAIDHIDNIDMSGLSALTPAMRTPADRAVIRQLRAARALLGWNQESLAYVCGVTAKTISNFERGFCVPSTATEYAIRDALEKAGIIFIQGDDDMGPGVRLAGNI